MSLYGSFIRKYIVPFLTAILCVSLEALCDLLGPTLMANIINGGIEKNSMEQVLYWGIRMLAVTALGACFAVTRNILAGNVSQRIGADLRDKLFHKIMRFSEEGIDKIESGSLITRMTNDTSQVIQFVNGIMRIFMKAPITCIGSIILASMLNLRLSLIIYGVVALVGFFIFLSMKLSYPRFSRLQTAMDRVNSVVQEYLIGVRLVKAFGTYEEETDRFETANSDLMKKGISSQMVITLISPVLSLIVGLGTALVIYTGSLFYPSGSVNVGDISAFTIYMSQILSSLLMITNVFNTFVRTKASAARLNEIMDCTEDAQWGGKAQKLPGAVTFERVTFAYPNGSSVPALKDISFTVRPGESLAVIGPTGSGKSTLVWLLLRFYDVGGGRILLDGHDLKTLDAATIRQSVAVVPQKATLFAGSAAENLKWGKPEASEQDIRTALLESQAGFLLELPEGANSRLEGAGVNLSGGQKQRLSIARGLIKDASVLVLDDATSALDAITEAKVRNALFSGEKQRTTILVTQRCTTAMYADRILVLENGACIGAGTHKELLRDCEVYREIYRSQVDSNVVL